MIRRLAAATAVVGAVLVLAAPAAFAHVTVQPSSAPKGSYSQLSFRVPNETDDTDTVKVKVQLPVDHPFGSVSVKPLPGWTYETTKAKLPKPITTDDGTVTDYISVVTWSGGKVAPGEYQDFSISVGPLPTDTDTLTFKAIQTYSDGSEVSWIEEPTAGGEEPEHPAPTLTLTAATGDHHASGTEDETATTVAADDDHAASGTETAASAVSKSDVDDANSKAVIALVVGALGLIAGLASIILLKGKAKA